MSSDRDYSLLADPVATVVEVRRFVNDSIRDLALQCGIERTDFTCECGDLLCRENVTLSLSDYDATEPGSVVGH